MLTFRDGAIRAWTLTAPLAGVTDPPFQIILAELGAPLVSTEMLAADGLARAGSKVLRNLSIAPGIHPILVQLFGKNPLAMETAAKIIADRGVDMIDLNMGCPAKKICRTGSGVALMRNPQTARAIMQAVRRAVNGPILSIKIRLGWDRLSQNAPEFIRMAEEEGFDFVTVHGRYRSSYIEAAEWAEIARIRAGTRLPIVGNGDVFSSEDARRMIDQTGCDAVMVGRGILGNPWLPARIEAGLTGRHEQDVTVAERVRVINRHLELLVDRYGDKRGSLIFRKHAAWYLRGAPGSAEMRREVFTFTTRDQYREFLGRIGDEWKSEEPHSGISAVPTDMEIEECGG